MKTFHRQIMIFSIVAVVAFAFALTFAADDAEAGHGEGVATIFPSYVIAGDYYSFVITYTVPESGFNNSGGSDPGWAVTIPSVTEYPGWDSATDPWSLPQDTDPSDFGYVTAEGAHKADATITITGRTVTITYDGVGGWPQHDEDLVLRYGNLLYRSQVQLHNELDVEFVTTVDEIGDGSFDAISDHPNSDVVPGDPDKIIVTILGGHDYVQVRKFNPNPYLSPVQIHTNMDGTVINPVPPDQVSGLDFLVEIRLTDRYLNLIYEEKGDDELDLQWGSVDDPPDAVPGKSPAPCSNSPEIQDWFSDWYDFYLPGPFPYDKQDIPVQFEDGLGIRYNALFEKRTYFRVTLYKVEQDVSLYVKNNQLYEWNTQLFNVLSPFEGTPTSINYGPCNFTDGESWWINPDTPISITNNDAIADVTIQYRVWYDGAWTDWQNGLPGENVTFTMNDLGVGGDCTHFIERRTYDKYCNYGPTRNETVFVDGTPPQSSFTPYGSWIEGSGFWWVDYSDYLTIDCLDYADCEYPAGSKYTFWRYEFEGDTFPDEFTGDMEIDGVWYWIYTNEQISFQEDCIHTIYYRNVDNVCNLEDENMLVLQVDGTPPVSTWHYDGDLIVEDLAEDIYWIDHQTEIWVTCEDFGCEGGVGTTDTFVRYTYDGISYPVDYNDDIYGPVFFDGEMYYWLYDGTPIIWTEDCEHVLYFYNVDDLGNKEAENNVRFWVDGTAPQSSSGFVPDVGHQFEDWITPDTEIWITCEDFGCNDGVGGQITYYRWTWDDGEGGPLVYYPSIVDTYDLEYGGFFWVIYDGPISWADDCIHTLYYLNIDALGNIEEYNSDTYYVDGTAPVSFWGFDEFEPGETLGDQIEDNGFWWIDWDTYVWLDCDDYGCLDGVGVYQTYYRIDFEGVLSPQPDEAGAEEINGVWYWPYERSLNFFEEDCNHTIYFLNVDMLWNVEAEQRIDFKVDGTAPESDWHFTEDLGVQIEDDPFWWIEYDTEIVLECEDYGCSGGVGDVWGNPTYFSVYWDETGIIHPFDEFDDTFGTPVYVEELDWYYYIYEGPISFDADCYHQIEFFNIDALGNVEVEWNYIELFVDGTSPVSTWEPFIDAELIYDDELGGYWMDFDDALYITCQDFGCQGGAGNYFDYPTYYGFWLDDGVTDPVWHPQAGEIDPLYGEPVEFPVGSGVYWWAAYDDIILYFDEECHHELWWFNVDPLGNVEGEFNVEHFYVDDTNPESSWGFVEDPDAYQIDDQTHWWIDYNTHIWLECEDLGCYGGVGGQITYWRWEWYTIGGQLIDSGPGPQGIWIEQDGGEGHYYAPYEEPISFTEDCNHIVYFLNVDALGNVEEENSIIFFVDGTDPISDWNFNPDLGVQMEDQEPTGEPFWWITPDTEIELTCEDWGCAGGVGDFHGNPTYYRWEWDTDADGETDDFYPDITEAYDLEYDGFFWVLYDGPISWADDCIHTLYWFNVDALNNIEEIQSETFKVDGTTPISEWGFIEGGTQIYDEIEDLWHIDWDTMIWLECYDYGCDNGVGGQITYWRYEYDIDNDGNIDESYPLFDDPFAVEIDGVYYWIYDFYPIQWQENCAHYLYFLNIDALGNVEKENMVKFLVDGSAPWSDKIIGDPQYGEGDWVTSETPLTLFGGDDDGFCAVGSWRIWWLVEWLNPATGEWEYIDNGTGDWYTNVIIYFTEECYHRLTWWAEDNLGNLEEQHVQYHYVDNTPPATWKTHDGDLYTEDQTMTITADVISDSDYLTSETDFTIPQVFGPYITQTGLVHWNDQILLGSTSGDLVGGVAMGHHSVIAADGPDASNGYGRGTFAWSDGPNEFNGYYVTDHVSWSNTFGRIYAVGTGPQADGMYMSGTFVGTVDNNGTQTRLDDVFTADVTFNFATAVGLNTDITIHADDLYSPCSVGSYTIFYRYYIDAEDRWMPEVGFYEGPNSEPVTFSFEEDCVHILEWYVVDNLGTESEHYFQQYNVDVTPPTSNKEVGECSYSAGEVQGTEVLDIVFIVDTSISMDPEWGIMNETLVDIIDQITTSGTNLSVTIYGLNENRGALYAGIAPYSVIMDTTWFNGANKTLDPTNHDHREDWGPGVSWVSLWHDWREGAIKVAIPISDECPYDGGASKTAEDDQAVAEAMALANANDIVVYGFYGGGGADVSDLMTELCEGTGGEAHFFDRNNAEDFAEKFTGIIADVTISYVSLSTPLTFTAEDDQSPCASGFSHFEYRVSWDANHDQVIDESESATEWITTYEYPFTYYFEEESFHCIEWRAVDNLGNKERIHVQYHYVDTLTPWIEKTEYGCFYTEESVADRVALFKDIDPFQGLVFGDPNEDVLNLYGIPYDVYGSSDMGIVDLSQYGKVIIVSDQTQSFYDALGLWSGWFEAYAAAGGIVEIHTDAINGNWGILPGGYIPLYSPTEITDIAMPLHPILNNPWIITDDELDAWGNANHGWFIGGLPVGSEVVLTTPIEAPYPVLVTSPWGDGEIVITTQPVEHAWFSYYSLLLENMILYGLDEPMDHTFMDTNSSIELEGDDTAGEQAHCVSGIKGLYWRFMFDGKWYPAAEDDWYYDDGTEEIVFDLGEYWYVYKYPITFLEECEHILQYFAEDNVCHVTEIYEQTYYVDKTAPTTTFEFGFPPSQGGDEVFQISWGYCELFDMTWAAPWTFIYLEAEDDGCIGGAGVQATFFKIYFEGIEGGETDWIEYFGPFTLYDLEEFYPGISNDSEHTIEWYSVDNVCKSEVVQSFTFQVDEEPPEPTILNPVFDWYYRPGHMIDMIFAELTGDELMYFEWYYSFDGENWTLIWAGMGDETTEVIWDSSVIPDPLCDDGPREVFVKIIVWDEHCRVGENETSIWFCKAENPHPCTQVITIAEGWNLISIAVELDSLGGEYTASKLAAEINSQAGDNIVKYIVRWDSANNEFNEYVVDNDIGWDFEIEKGEGYYIYSLSPFDVDFIIVGDCAECEYIDLEVCWNLIGWDSMGWMWVGEFVDLVNGAAGADVVQAVVRHDFADEYEAWYPGDNPFMFRMETNYAYWVFVAQDVNNVPLP